MQHAQHSQNRVAGEPATIRRADDLWMTTVLVGARRSTSRGALFWAALFCLRMALPAPARAASDDAEIEPAQVASPSEQERDEAVVNDGQLDSGVPKYLLRYKFQRGEVMRYEVKHSANVRTTIESKTQQVESESQSVKAWKVTDVLPDGAMEFVHVVESVKMTNQTPGGAVNRFDSKDKTAPPPGFEQAARAVGVPLTLVRLSPNGKILERTEKHPQPPASDDLPITLELSPEPLAVGETWDSFYDVPAEQKSGRLNVRTRRVCRLKSVDENVARIEVEYQILTPVDAYVRSQLAERLTKGTVVFDLDQGRIVSQQHDVDARILGFAGKASSMHFLARTQERLLPDDSLRVARP